MKPIGTLNNYSGRSECFIVNTRLMDAFEQYVPWLFLLLSNAKMTQKMNEGTFMDNESSNNYEMFNTKYQEIRIQSIVFVTLRIPNNKTEVFLTKKETPIEQHTRYWFEIHLY